MGLERLCRDNQHSYTDLVRLRKDEEYTNQLKLLRTQLTMQLLGPRLFHDPTDPNADENGNVTKLVGELTPEQKEMYISDQHWDSKIRTNKFRRRVVDDLFGDLSDEERQTFIETGELPGDDPNDQNLRMEEARRKWREVSRLSVTVKPDGTQQTPTFSENVVMGGYAVPVDRTSTQRTLELGLVLHSHTTSTDSTPLSR